MPLETSPSSPRQELHWGSDIATVHFDGRALVVVVARAPLARGRFEGLRIEFAQAFAFRYLDELALARYWTSSGFLRGHHVLEVNAGGWSDEENELQGYGMERREWLVVTGNGCLSVFASRAPQIQPGEYDAA